MQKSVTVSKEFKSQLVNHAKASDPNEACALLFGKIKNNQYLVSEIFLADNTDQSPVNFTISNDDLLKAYKFAESKNLDMVAIFHSHPNAEARPSETDKKFMQANPVIWIIYSGISDSLKGFYLDQEIEEVKINIV